MGAIQRLNLAFLVDAQHERPIRWVHVEPNHIRHFLFELWVVRDLERAHQVRLEPGFGPDALHARVADSHRSRHRPNAPVRLVRRRLCGRLRQHFALHRGRQWLLAGRPCLVMQQPIDTFLQIALLPAPDTRLGFASQLHDRVGAKPVSCRQHDIRAPHDLARTVAIRNHRLKPCSVRSAHVDADVVTPHARTLTDLRSHGNPLSVTKH